MKIALKTMFRPLIIMFVCLMGQAASINGQTITVSVKAESPLDIKRVEVNVTLIESKLDYVQPDYPGRQELMSAEMFLLELNDNQIENTIVDSNSESKKHYSRVTKKEQVETTVKSNFQIIVNSNSDFAKFQELMSISPNAQIISTDYRSKSEDITLKKLTDKLLKEARISADKMGEMINRRTTNLSNLKVLNMQTKGHPKHIMLYVLEQKAYLELEVTYDTENL